MVESFNYDAEMRIAVLTHDDSPNAYYRAHMPMQALQQRGHQVAFAWIRGPADVPALAALRGFDIVYFWRLFYPPIWKLARALAASGIGVVWDNDDDLAALPKHIPAHRQYGGPNARRTRFDMRAMMQAAHVVTAPSRGLAGELERVGGKRVTVVENYLSDVFDRPRTGKSSVTIGWTASLEHYQDWQGLKLAPLMERLLDEHHDLEIKSIGVRLGLRASRYERANRVLVTDLPRFVSNFDIGIAPLTDVPFNRARSNIKLKEYAAVGVAWVASDVGPYRGMGEEQGGVVVSEDGWYDVLNALVVDAKRRRKLASDGAKWARTQTIATNVQRWENVLQEAVERASAARVAPAG